MPPPSPSFHQARIIPIEIPAGKNRNNSHSDGLTRFIPSPKMKSKTIPMLAMLQTLAVRRTTIVIVYCPFGIAFHSHLQWGTFCHPQELITLAESLCMAMIRLLVTEARSAIDVVISPNHDLSGRAEKPSESNPALGLRHAKCRVPKSSQSARTQHAESTGST